ncbi:helix-turn-helix domain-containing protein [Cohnella fermenti]|uniref:helix-turn-helix domain-containing protein n=1 Tax=Cohnella fermenti TaxID=2565925 RepID=UPI001454C403|nr:helix-turn-helix domain-containing protein [Cohnella fermenti]
MYRALIVDDQYFALLGLEQGIAWEELGIGEVCLAETAEQATECLRSREVNLLICDIEMPGRSGLELLEWTGRHCPDTLTIMLTCHADFEYAQRAIHHGAYHYLLKPVDYEQLQRVAVAALAEGDRRREHKRFELLMQEYRTRWEHQLPLLVERFWQDILGERASPLPQSLQRSMDTYGLRFLPEDRFTLVLLGLEKWKENLSARDEAIMEYALRNLAGELLLGGTEGVVFQDHAGLNIAILYERGERAGSGGRRSVDVLVMRCRRFQEEAERLLRCTLSIYLSPPTPLPNIVQAYTSLTDKEQRNTNRPRQIFVPSDDFALAKSEALSAAAPLPLFADWLTILELGETDELNRRIRQWFSDREGDAWSKESHWQFVHGILFIIHTVLGRKGLSAHDSKELRKLTDGGNYPKLRIALQDWTRECFEAAADLLKASNNVSSTVVSKISRYIRSRLDRDITREELAAHVYLNPAYLSRMFKKETGLSLSDAIIQERIQEAKRLLEKTELKITDIAGEVGYSSLGSFSNLFKRVVGVTPQQYRARMKTELRTT